MTITVIHSVKPSCEHGINVTKHLLFFETKRINMRSSSAEYFQELIPAALP
jgi:hypothetical protein